MPDLLAKDAVAYLPDLIYTNGRFESGVAILCDRDGCINGLSREPEGAGKVIRLKDRAALPGLVNAHSHAFQRVIRGRTERRMSEHDSFWTWREMMYSAAARLTPEDIYDASRMAFLEMALCGIASVGEFHYIHRAPDGTAYYDANLTAKIVIKAARDVGLRIALLSVAYARSGFKTPMDERQKRFIEAEPDRYLHNVETLRAELSREDVKSAWVGIAPHSVRAVPLRYLREIISYSETATQNSKLKTQHSSMPVHMHVAEQPAEVGACLEEYNRTPVQLLESEGFLSPNFTAVHAIHVTPEEARWLARAGATVCACPTTERNLGDGIVPADPFFREGVTLALGTDSHAQIDLLEDARELEYHLRLQKLERAVLAPEDKRPSALAARLFDCATVNGARSINGPGGLLEPGRSADFFTVDLNDPSIAGAATDDLLSHIVFGMARTAVRDVFVGGRQIVSSGRTVAQSEIVDRFGALQKRLWS
ncbi:MAG TPA: formimidoylglutamate deiminase [Pyrinomonadaceae bacterium]|nr:formimidoylglutamate deiminase [Pyrinomonadaceae bacterium]